MIGLGLIFALMTIVFLLVLGLFAGGIGSLLKEKKNVAEKDLAKPLTTKNSFLTTEEYLKTLKTLKT